MSRSFVILLRHGSREEAVVRRRVLRSTRSTSRRFGGRSRWSSKSRPRR